jgi:flagellin-specific chaperone FliS
MKIKLSELKKIIKEETLSEDQRWEADRAQDAERGMGLYLEVEAQKRIEQLLSTLYSNAVNDATVDLGNEYEAIEIVKRSMEKMFNDWLSRPH